jgi:S1-C subfamily serine protease
MRQAVAGDELSRPCMGVFYREVTLNLAEERDLPVDYGVLVLAPEGSDQPAVIAGSPAAQAGLREGDLVTAVGGERIDASRTLDDLLTQYQPGDEATLSVLRDGEELELVLKLGTRPAD